MKSLPISFLLLVLVSCTSSSTSRGKAPAEFVPVSGDHAVFLYSGGGDAWFKDAKDQSLKRALEHVDARIAELPAELEDESIPATMLRWLWNLGCHPSDLRIGMTESETMPVSGQILVQCGDAETARATADTLAEILSGFGVPSLGKSESVHGLSMVPIGPVSAYHGAPDDGANGFFVISASEPDLSPVDVGSLDLPEGVKPFFAYKIDYQQMARLVETAGADAMQNPLLASMRGTVLQGGAGFGTDRIYGGMRQRGWHASMQEMGFLPSGPLSEQDLALVPRDATWAVLTRMKLSGLTTAVRDMVKDQPELGGMDPFEALATFTGFDFDKELMQHLGETWGVYTADSTGGGGMLSAVVFIAIANPAGMEKSLDWMSSEVAGLSDAHAKGYVRVEKSTTDKRARWLLTFPGLPVPAEAVIELAGGYLFAALSPQAVDAAVNQALRGESSLLDQPRFSGLASGDLDDLYSLAYADTPRFAHDGYALTNMACAALSNATRSKVDRERGTSAILPAYTELLRDAKAMVSLGRLDGEDLVVTTQADRSMLVNACAMVGQYQGLLALAGIGGAALPKIIEEQQRAAAERAATQPHDPTMDPDAVDMDAEKELDEMMDDMSDDDASDDQVEDAPEPR